jgi:alcohol dehydrogenase, propanol-preferring
MNPSSPPPTTRKVAVVAKPNSPQSIIISDRPIAKPTGTQILIKIEASGVCATDLHLVRRSMPYLQPEGGIDVCGHEGVGRIVELGPDVDATKGWSVGQRVAHRWVWSWCGECEICKGGNEQLCDERRQSGVHVEGCWAGRFCFLFVCCSCSGSMC